ncbi:MAG: hypothetical protein K2Y37_14535 [Pirellulales bacterium]|nr:hypothetical protein [Pirellulales bacterium]
MRYVALAWLVVLCGCARWHAPPGPACATQQPGQVFVPCQDSEFVYKQVADVVDDYFRIQEEEHVRVIGDTAIEGRIDTYPVVGATLLEPWRRDTAGYERLESTFQTTRRFARVRIIPSPGGHLVEFAVYKELEDLLKPERATAGAATFRNDSSVARYNEPVLDQAVTAGWIGQGRDADLESRMVANLARKMGPVGVVPAMPRQVSPSAAGPAYESEYGLPSTESLPPQALPLPPP